MIAPERGPVLLAIAREAIATPFEDEIRERWPQPWLEERAATFVTLHLEGDLRGCIGTLEALRRLGDDVQSNARAAAYRDPRFSPVMRHEVAALQVEVSVLSARELVAVSSESEAIAALRPGIDGVVLEYEGQRSTFLPQVWESLADPLDFLTQLRLKAELPARFWHPRLKLSRYTVDKYL